MADAIERALAELDRHLARLEPGARKELLGEAANHLEDLRVAHGGDAEAAVREFGNPRTLSPHMLRAFGVRRSRALAVLTFMGPMVLVAFFVASASGLHWEFVWFILPLLLALAVVAYRTRRFAWREIGVGALAGAFASWLFLASATIDLGEQDGGDLLFAPTAQSTMEVQRKVYATGSAWLPTLKLMERGYAKGDPRALASLTTSEGYLVPSNSTEPYALEHASELPTMRVKNLGKAKGQWRTTGATMLRGTRQATQDAQRGVVEYPETVPTLADRFLPQLVGFLPTAVQVATVAFVYVAGIHLLMLGLRFVVEALWRRLRLGVAG